MNNNYNYNNNYQQTRNTSQLAVFCFINGSEVIRPYVENQVNRLNHPSFQIKDIRTELCTHIVFSGAELDIHQYGIRAIDSELETRSGEFSIESV